MLRGDSTPGLQTSYEDTTLNQWDLIPDGPYPLNALYDAVLNAEESLANCIADTGGHPWRDYLLSFTAALSNGDVLPSTDANGDPIIGQLGSVYDSDSTTLVCTEQPTEVIRRWIRMGSYYKQEFYYYAIDGNGITHTRDNVIIQVCIYNRATQLAAIEANNDMVLPDSLTDSIVAGALAFLGIERAGMYATIFEARKTAIRAGLTTVPSVAMGGGATLVEAVST